MEETITAKYFTKYQIRRNPRFTWWSRLSDLNFIPISFRIDKNSGKKGAALMYIEDSKRLEIKEKILGWGSHFIRKIDFSKPQKSKYNNSKFSLYNIRTFGDYYIGVRFFQKSEKSPRKFQILHH